jgi:hypothetical protein
MSSSAFVVCFLVGSGAVALWLDNRFPSLAPESFKATFLHVGGTIVAAQLLSPLALHFLGGSRLATLLVVFLAVFPALTYSLIVAIWLLKLMTNALRGRFH